ncbi:MULTISPECIES: cysteine-rich CWC family protein [unclassified Sporosarcina]|uniref:cysteine-rich CWC family protein n=1 Tax=unclassified Sporosarcina TaxID=2647733 RepID=UPI002040CB84|nr:MULTISPECIES: cysteine-rich CWC family protein [unclassified Sporosarcina]
MSATDVCPICKGDNHCGNGLPKEKGVCWCTSKTFPEEVFFHIPEQELHKHCICQHCLEKIAAKKQAGEGH